MKDFDLTYIRQHVRNILDQNMTTDGMDGFGDVETLELDEVIDEQVCAGARLIELAAPIDMLGKGTPGEGSLSYVGASTAHISYSGLPSNFLREIFFKLKCWEVGITSFSEVGSKDYFMLHSENVSLLLSSRRPVAVRVPIRDKICKIEAYYTGSDERVDDFLFIPEPAIAKNDTVSLCEKLEKPILYAIASLVANSFGAVQQSMNLMSTAKALAGISEQPQQVQPNNQSE